MFRDERQIGAVARVLLARVNRAELVEADAPGLWAGGRALLHLAFALWNGWPHGRMRELLALDAGKLAAVGELLTALAQGGAAVDGWLDEHGPPRDLAGRAG